MRVVVIPYDSPGTVAYYTVVRTGSRDEVEAGHSGFAHFFEHMMFRGTEKYSPDAYNEVLKRHGRRLQRLHHRRPDGLPHRRAGERAADDDGHRVRPLPEPQVRRGRLPHRGAGRARRVQQERLEPRAADVREAARPRLRRSTPTSTRRSASSRTSRRCRASTTTACSSSTASTGRRTRRCWWWATSSRRTVFDLAKKYYGDWKKGYQAPDVPVEPPQKERKKAHLDWPEPDAPLPDDRLPHARPSPRPPTDSAALDLIGAAPVQRVGSPLPGAGGRTSSGWTSSRAGRASTATPRCSWCYARVKSDDLVPKVKETIDRYVKQLADQPVDSEAAGAHQVAPALRLRPRARHARRRRRPGGRRRSPRPATSDAINQRFAAVPEGDAGGHPAGRPRDLPARRTRPS